MPRECGSCGGSLIIGGPIWSGRIHNLDFVETLQDGLKSETFGTQVQIERMLTGIMDERYLEK